MHIGIDDTDSTRKGCTTYIAALLVEQLTGLGAKFIDYPNLVRLNPNVPWKTRGNGALCLRIQYPSSIENKIKKLVTDTVERRSDLEIKGTDPAVVFFENTEVPEEIRAFSQKTVTDIASLREAMRLVAKYRGEAVAFKNGRGIIGSLAAVGEILEIDHTYEVLAYRTPENCGSKREVDEASVFEMDEATRPDTFNNIDLEKHRVIITPRGPDPILFGIRGENPEIVKKALTMIRVSEPIERWVVFRTNQGTDAHLREIRSLNQIKSHRPVIAKGRVSATPKMIKGRHIIFSISDETGQVDCAAYEPTGFLRRAARRLMVGDCVQVYGGVRQETRNRPLTINLEKICLLELKQEMTYQNPLCPKCGKRLKSMGKSQGFRCEKCGFKSASISKVSVKVKRELKEGLYIASTRSQRHLTKPYTRYGREKNNAGIDKLIEGWHFP